MKFVRVWTNDFNGFDRLQEEMTPEQLRLVIEARGAN
jgi:hypothetical protein